MITEQEIYNSFEELFEENKQVGTFGVKYLDDKLCGILKGDLVLIGARSGCVDKETEFFSQAGWKKISEYQYGDMVLQYNTDNDIAELVYPQAYIKKPCNEFYHFKTMYGVDMMLSAEHNVLYKTARKNFMKSTVVDLYDRYTRNKKGLEIGIPTTFTYCSKTKLDLSDDEIKLMLAVICDGHFSNPNTNLCRINIKKQRKIKELKKILEALDLDYRVNIVNEYNQFYFYAPRHEKHFTKDWYNCNREQLKLICDNILQWDGSTSKGRMKFHTTIKESADFIQFAFSSCGYRATLTVQDRRGRVKTINNKDYVTKSIDYNVQITKRTLPSLANGKNKNLITKVKVNDYKYCFTVPSSNLVLRRNGKIFVTGNSGKSTIAQNIAEHNANMGVKVTLFSLENFKGDNLLTAAYYKYKELTKMWDLSQRVFVTRKFNIDKEALKQAELFAYNKLKNIDFVYRQNDYTRDDLKDGIVKAIRENKAEMLIIDHIDYLDKFGNETELEHITSLMKEIRDAQIAYKIPVICISHLRKNGTSEVKIPSMDEFIGSSNKAKISTVSILFAPDDNENTDLARFSRKATWCCIRKLRMGGFDNTCAKLYFDKRTGTYENKYELFKVNFSGTKVEPLH